MRIQQWHIYNAEHEEKSGETIKHVNPVFVQLGEKRLQCINISVYKLLRRTQ